MLGWGRAPDSYYAFVNSHALLEYKDTFKFMLILSVPYSDVDRMTDTRIAKSKMFTITGDTIMIGIPITQLPRVSAPSGKKIGDTFDATIMYNIVVLPKNNSEDLIKSLADVGNSGGKIVGSSVMSDTFIKGENSKI